MTVSTLATPTAIVACAVRVARAASTASLALAAGAALREQHQLRRRGTPGAQRTVLRHTAGGTSMLRLPALDPQLPSAPAALSWQGSHTIVPCIRLSAVVTTVDSEQAAESLLHSLRYERFSAV